MEAVQPRPSRYLTKSRFKLALECPTKLFYTGKPQLYPDAKQEDDFLQALAEGGFQVGELAKQMFPEGVEVTATTHDEQVQETLRLLQRNQVTIFEAAIRHGDLFVRVDVLRKSGNAVELIEVKAKSYDPAKDGDFRSRSGIKSGWRPYLMDVAFQTHVFRLAFPGLNVSSFLMLADKSRLASVDGLNQRFRIRRVGGRPVVHIAPGTDAHTIGAPLLAQVQVDSQIGELWLQPADVPGERGLPTQLAQNWAAHYREDRRIAPHIGAQCARCEFRAEDPAAGKRSGRHECWQLAAGMSAAGFERGTVLDLYRYPAKKKQGLIDRRLLRLDDVPLTELDSDRQRMQVSGQWPGRPDFFLDAAVMRAEMARWRFPLHFIDFETSRVAIPFFAGQRPYGNIAFQFSHHVVEAVGQVAHRHEFLSTTPGRRPNYDFVRALKAALGNEGTVFMWSKHERSTLDAIAEELAADAAPPADAALLQAFIDDLTRGAREMVDLCELAQRAFFHPVTRGSSSIKKVLPAVMAASTHLKAVYGCATYGAAGGIPSLNFRGQAWWQQREDGTVADPYSLLPPVFDDIPTADAAELVADEDMEIAQGGAATAAYARLQFDDLSATERQRIEAALKRYCELDTLAMVMVYQAWREWVEGR